MRTQSRLLLGLLPLLACSEPEQGQSVRAVIPGPPMNAGPFGCGIAGGGTFSSAVGLSTATSTAGLADADFHAGGILFYVTGNIDEMKRNVKLQIQVMINQAVGGLGAASTSWTFRDSTGLVWTEGQSTLENDCEQDAARYGRVGTVSYAWVSRVFLEYSWTGSNWVMKAGAMLRATCSCTLPPPAKQQQQLRRSETAPPLQAFAVPITMSDGGTSSSDGGTSSSDGGTTSSFSCEPASTCPVDGLGLGAIPSVCAQQNGAPNQGYVEVPIDGTDWFPGC